MPSEKSKGGEGMNQLMLLAKACAYVEQDPDQANGDGEARVLSDFHPYAKHPAMEVDGNSPGARAGSSRSSSRNGARRAGGGTREIHNQMEKNRRAQLRMSFERLQCLVEDGTGDGKKMSNLTILQKALVNIEGIKQREGTLGHRQRRVTTANQMLRARVHILRRVIVDKDPSMDIDSFLREERRAHDARDSATSTASEGAEEVDGIVATTNGTDTNGSDRDVDVEKEGDDSSEEEEEEDEEEEEVAAESSGATSSLTSVSASGSVSAFTSFHGSKE